jgi:tRNA threonylcarbamoyladenosine biosynthesis protein TsaB
MILHIETSTKICSVALSSNGELVGCIESSSDQFIHGEALTGMIQELLRQHALEITCLTAVSVAIGPGSYTGLRIGLATAKGLVFGLGVQFIGISSLESLTELARENYPKASIAAAFDARRDEVFLRIQQDETLLLNDQPAIITETYSSPILPLVWVGDANSKLKSVLSNAQHVFADDILPSATGQVRIAFNRFVAGGFDDIEQIKPNYTKAFYTGTAKA